jgi:Cys-tRNA synthase (O-phospho-L-seryl-tRNA:Cys-tRNA synthase)
MNKTSVPFLAERFRKIAKDEAAKFFFFLESLRSNCIVLIVDGQWNVLAKTPIGIYI